MITRQKESWQVAAAPMIPWIGGKRRLARHILPLFPEHSCYVEPFCGAAALFFMKAPSAVEVINDLNGELVSLFRVVQHHLDELMRQFRWALASREIYGWLRTTPPDTLTEIQRAARFFYLMKCGFSGKVESLTFGTATTARPRLNLLRLEEDLSAVHLRLHQVTIERGGWNECVRRYDRPHTLFYMDPPYWGAEGYGVDFGLEQYTAMASALRTMKGKALVSVNDIPEMREAFAGFPMKELSITYFLGRGSLKSKSEPKSNSELLIANFPIS
ncbi:DNA adenine methylase [Verminephrobacter aporrectodeae subsp. tuberculatae]|uniref:DNA adenine methylase n=1 Tax=Verminephrobacter aporrectodeae TaxID=1110389 RepID=UPI002243960C|nr:DNA adenine methylase [Verminephrobacter aporrectodeae]MCW8199312.1 DNA adenine methylase [Verminephrobacter aporrectodeae subsp. tuberculatae]